MCGELVAEAQPASPSRLSVLGTISVNRPPDALTTREDGMPHAYKDMYSAVDVAG